MIGYLVCVLVGFLIFGGLFLEWNGFRTFIIKMVITHKKDEVETYLEMADKEMKNIKDLGKLK